MMKAMPSSNHFQHDLVSSQLQIKHSPAVLPGGPFTHTSNPFRWPLLTQRMLPGADLFLPRVLQVTGGSKCLGHSGRGGRQTQVPTGKCGLSWPQKTCRTWPFQGPNFSLTLHLARNTFQAPHVGLQIKMSVSGMETGPFSLGWKEKCAEGELTLAGGSRRQPADVWLRSSLNQPSHPLF